MDIARPSQIEPATNRYGVHALARIMLPLAIRLGIHPNTVTLAGLAFGLGAAAAYLRWPDWRYATLGFLCMIGWHVMDGLDGKLARATGKTSAFGRLLDGVADYSCFVAVYIALAITQPEPLPAIGIALVSGAAHALQSQFYEGERATWIRRSAGQYEAVARSEAGGAFERLYNRLERALGNQSRPFDVLLHNATPAERQRLIAAWQPRSARVLHLMGPLSANGRTIAIWLAAMIGNPWLFWLWEIIPLTILALVAARWLRQAEIRAAAAALAD